jgi:hypothetical protein
MATTQTAQKKVLYKYQPDLPYYFDQNDILEVKNSATKKDIIRDICNKNSCNENEVEIMGVFDDNESLNNFCASHGLRYLI